MAPRGKRAAALQRVTRSATQQQPAAAAAAAAASRPAPAAPGAPGAAAVPVLHKPPPRRQQQRAAAVRTRAAARRGGQQEAEHQQQQQQQQDQPQKQAIAKARRGRKPAYSAEAAALLESHLTSLMAPVPFSDEQAARSCMLLVMRSGGGGSPARYPRYRWQGQYLTLAVAGDVLRLRLEQLLGLQHAAAARLAKDAAAAAAATANLPAAVALRHAKAVLCALPAATRLQFVYNTVPSELGCSSDVDEQMLADVLDGDTQLYVFRRLPAAGRRAPQLVPRVVVAHSAVLAGLQEQPQLGVYAWQPFPAGSVVGVYLAEVLGSAASTRIKLMVARDLQGPRYNALITVDGHLVNGRASPWGGHASNAKAVIWPGDRARERVLFDCSRLSWPGMLAHLMNDGRGSTRGANVQVTEPDGVVQALTDIPAWDITADAEGNAASELLWGYGGNFWTQL